MGSSLSSTNDYEFAQEPLPTPSQYAHLERMLTDAVRAAERGPPTYDGKRIHTIFVSSDKNPELKETFQNQFAEWRLGSPMLHCEIYFPDEKLTFTVSKQSPARWWRDRTYQRSWIVLEHTVSVQQYDLVKALLNMYVGRRFDRWGFWGGVLCSSGRCVSNTHTFCSRIIGEVYSHPLVMLIDARRVEEPSLLTPPQIYNLLKDHSHTPPMETVIRRVAATSLF